MMDLYHFFSAHRAEWPLGQMHVVNQTHLLPAGMPITHPLLSNGFLATADVIQVLIQGPTLQTTEVKQFMRQIAEIAPEDCTQEYDVRPSTLDCISVSILAGKLHDA